MRLRVRGSHRNKKEVGLRGEKERMKKKKKEQVKVDLTEERKSEYNRILSFSSTRVC